MDLHARGLETNHLVSKASISRWNQRINLRVQSGNKTDRKLRGYHVFRMVIYRMCYPKCTLDQLRRFLFVEVDPHILFTREVVSQAETDIGMRTKRLSITATQALLPHNIVRRFLW
jgi:hypothetical protein